MAALRADRLRLKAGLSKPFESDPFGRNAESNARRDRPARERFLIEPALAGVEFVELILDGRSVAMESGGGEPEQNREQRGGPGESAERRVPTTCVGESRSASGPAVNEIQDSRPVARASSRAISPSRTSGKVSHRSRSQPSCASTRARSRCAARVASGSLAAGLRSGR